LTCIALEIIKCLAKTEFLHTQTLVRKTWDPEIFDGDTCVDAPEDAASSDFSETPQLTKVATLTS
jgi:hypothetical protein